MNRNGLPPVSKSIRRARWVLFALLALAPLALVSQNQSAQKNSVEVEEKTTGTLRFYIIIEALP